MEIMTKQEFFMSGYHNVQCRFTFDNGAEASGVVSSYYFDEPDRLDLVKSTDLIEFQKLMAAQDHASMKQLSRPIALETVVKAVRLN